MSSRETVVFLSVRVIYTDPEWPYLHADPAVRALAGRVLPVPSGPTDFEFNPFASPGSGPASAGD